MKCVEFETRINDLLDARQRPEADAAVREHVTACAPCRKLLAGYESLCDGVELFEAPALARDFSEMVVAASLVEPAPPRRWLTLRAGLGALAALAALLLLALLPRILSHDRNRTAHNPPPNQPGLAIGQPGPRHHPEAKVVVQETKKPAPSPSATKAPAVAVNEPITPKDAALEMEQYRQFVENLAPQLPDEAPLWVNHLAGGIRPVANSFGEALHVLSRTLPGKSEETRPTKPSAERYSPSEFPVA